jgi:putative MATE family efflux protein
VVGTGIGTSLGQISGGLIVLVMFARGRAGLRVEWRRLFAAEWGRIRRILNVGLPAGAEQLMLQLALINMAAIVTRLGTEAFAAHIVTLRLTALSYLPGFGFSVAATTLVGQELGARRPDRARASVIAALTMSVGVMSLAAILIFVFDAAILGFFTSDPLVVAAGVPTMQLAAAAQPVIATAFVFGGALRGAGDTRATMIVTVFSVWGLRLVLAYLLAFTFNLGLIGVWLAFNVDWLNRAVLYWLRFRAGKWQLVRV